MNNIFLSEIPNIPKALQVEIISGLGLAELVYENGEIKCPDGTIWSPEDVEKLLEDYINNSTSEELEDTLTLVETYIVDVTNINYDVDDKEDADHLPQELTFVMYLDAKDNDDVIEQINEIIDDMISNKTNFCFSSCSLTILKYVPYKGVEYIDTGS